MLLPSTCGACGRTGPAPCQACWARLRPAPPAAPPAGVDWWASLLVYEGEARELVARLKYRNARAALPWLAAGMAGLVVAAGEAVDVVTWAPTTPTRRRVRGFDQAELLARAVAARLRRPARRLLARPAGLPQTGRAAAARREGPPLSARWPASGGWSVLVVDDVTTTGATLTAAARALRAAGFARIVAVTAGRTPLKVAARGADP